MVEMKTSKVPSPHIYRSLPLLPAHRSLSKSLSIVLYSSLSRSFSFGSCARCRYRSYFLRQEPTTLHDHDIVDIGICIKSTNSYVHQVFSRIGKNMRQIVMEFMDLEDLANMMGVNNGWMWLITYEVQPIPILSMIPTTDVKSCFAVAYQYVRYFVPQRTPISTVIALINRLYPAPGRHEYVYTDYLWNPLQTVLSNLDVPVAVLPRRTLMLQFRSPDSFLSYNIRQNRRSREAWEISRARVRVLAPSRREARQQRQLARVMGRAVPAGHDAVGAGSAAGTGDGARGSYEGGHGGGGSIRIGGDGGGGGGHDNDNDTQVDTGTNGHDIEYIVIH
jgi:hypothetical protein